MAQRVTLRKRQPYNTTSNRRRVVKTPGGKLVVHHLKKKAVSVAQFGDETGLDFDYG
jgi:large subunit ribosomal protein L34e